MRFLADENIASSVIHVLRNVGYEVFDVKEMNLKGKSDKDLISYATKKKCIILTHDKDFLNQRKISIILLRFYNQKPRETAKHLLAFLNTGFIKKLKKPTNVVLSENMVEFHYPLMN